MVGLEISPANLELVIFSFHRHSWYRRAAPCECPTEDQPSEPQTCPEHSDPDYVDRTGPTVN